MTIGIDPTVDFAFKKLLGSPDHPAITLHFLNAVLGGDPLIASVEILNPFLDKDFEDDKLAILDVRATDDHGHLLNIEMQTNSPGELPQRLAYYVAQQYVSQMKEGDHYKHLKPSIAICVLRGLMFPQVSDLHLDFRLRSREPAVKLCDSLQIHLLELPKYTASSDISVITDPIEQWAYFFQEAVSLTPQQLSARLGDEAFAEAAGVLEMIARSPRERELYEARLKMQRDEHMRFESARDESRAQGRAQGRAEGLAKGRALGRVQVLQQFLGVRETSSGELENLTLDELVAVESDQQRQLRDRA